MCRYANEEIYKLTISKSRAAKNKSEIENPKSEIIKDVK